MMNHGMGFAKIVDSVEASYPRISVALRSQILFFADHIHLAALHTDGTLDA